MWNPNPFFGGYQQPQQYQQPVRAQVPQVNGEGGAKAYSLAPNSTDPVHHHTVSACAAGGYQ